MIGEKGSTHFTAKEVAAVNKFHNAMADSKEYYVAENNVEAVCRGGGAVLCMVNGNNQDVTISNGGGTVKAGTYKDLVSGGTFTVTSDKISGHIGDTGIAVFYDGAAAVSDSSSSSSTVTAKPTQKPSSDTSTTTASGKQAIYFDNSSYFGEL